MVLSSFVAHSWTQKKTSEWFLDRMDVSERLLAAVNRRKMAFIDHTLRGKNKTGDLLLGMVYGTRGRGKPEVRYNDSIERGFWWKK